jgi:hypothetical protein
MTIHILRSRYENFKAKEKTNKTIFTITNYEYKDQ